MRHFGELKATPGRLPALLMIVLLMLGTTLQFFPRTAEGTQCPTAPVQTFRVAVKDCCGKIVRFETRTPRPGDSSFVQCRCEEKKSTAQVAALSSRLDPFVTTEIEYDPGARLLIRPLSPTAVVVIRSRTRAPSTRPPTQS